MTSEVNTKKEFKWSIDAPIFGTRLVRKQLFIALGLPLLILFIFLAIISKGEIFSSDFKFFLYLILALSLLTYLFTKIIYKGVFTSEFIVNEEGVFYQTSKNQKSKSKAVAFLVMILSIFAKTPGAAAAGYASQTNLGNEISWENVKTIDYHNKDRIIYVKSSFSDKIAIFCTSDNYSEVKDYIKNTFNN
ncbi:MAG: hypothetical protein ACLFPS_04450 [Clostridia bacterium]